MDKFRNIKSQFSFLSGNLLVLVVSFMFFRTSVGFTRSYYPIYLRQLGASPFLIGMISSIGSFFIGIMRIPGGFIADNYGRKKIIVLFTYAVGLSYLIFALAPDWRFIVIGTIINNISFIYLPALEALEADSIPEEDRGIGFAASQKLPQITNIFAPLITIYLIKKLGFLLGVRIAYILATLAAIIAGYIRQRYLKETLVNVTPFKFKVFYKSMNQSIDSIFSAWKLVPINVKYFTVAMLLLGFQQPIFQNFHSLYAIDIVGVSDIQWGQLNSISMFIGFLLALPVGKYMDIIGRKKSLVLYFVFSIPTIVALLISRGFYQHLLIIVLFGVSNSFFPSFAALQADLIPSSLRGRIMGSMWTMINFSMIFGSFIGGFLYEIYPVMPFLLGIFLQTVSLSIIIIKIK